MPPQTRRQILKQIPWWKNREPGFADSLEWLRCYWLPHGFTLAEVKEYDPALWWNLYHHNRKAYHSLRAEERLHAQARREIEGDTEEGLEKKLQMAQQLYEQHLAERGAQPDPQSRGMNRRVLRRVYPDLFEELQQSHLLHLVPEEPLRFGGDPKGYYLKFLNGVPRRELHHHVCSSLSAQLRRNGDIWVVPTITQLREQRFSVLQERYPEMWKDRKDGHADPATWAQQHYPGLSIEDILGIDISLYMRLRKRGELDKFEPKHDFMRDVRFGFTDDPVGHAKQYWPGYTLAELDTAIPPLPALIREKGLEHLIPA